MKLNFLEPVWVVLAVSLVGIASASWADEPVVLVPASTPPITNADDDPARFVLTGSVEYQRHFSQMMEAGPAAAGNRIKISFEPMVAFLPASITIDLDSMAISQADVSLIRLWILNVLAYHRNTDANIAHDIEFLSVRYPVHAMAFGTSAVQTSVVITVGAATGFRWMNDSHSGLYLEPNAGLSSTTSILNRIFVSAFGYASATAIGAGEPNYLTGVAGAQIGVGLTRNNLLRIAVNGSLRYDGANSAADLPAFSQYLGAALEWGAPKPQLNSSMGLR